MKCFATLLYPLVSITILGIHTVTAADQIVIPSVPMDAERPTSHSRPTLFDLLTIESSTSIFFSYARELDLVRLFTNVDANITVLVPTNKAVMALEKKPHQAPIPVEDTIELTEQELEERSEKNVERWVSLHIIPQSHVSLPSRTYPTLAEGKTITFEEIGRDPSIPEWKRVLVNGKLQIISRKEATNGVLYVIDGTIQDE